MRDVINGRFPNKKQQQGIQFYWGKNTLLYKYQLPLLNTNHTYCQKFTKIAPYVNVFGFVYFFFVNF